MHAYFWTGSIPAGGTWCKQNEREDEKPKIAAIDTACVHTQAQNIDFADRSVMLMSDGNFEIRLGSKKLQ